MSVSAGFTPTGLTVAFTAATTAPTPVQAISTTLGGNQYRIFNSGAGIAFIGVGASSGVSSANATVITTTGNAIPISPGAVEILTFAPNAWFTGITSSGTAVFYITPGDGV